MAKFMGQGEAAASSVVIAVQHDESDVIGMLNKNTGGAIAEWFNCNVDAEVAFDESDEIGDATDTGGCRRQHFAGELACAGFGSRCWVVEPTWSGREIARSVPSRTAPRKLVFDSIVDVPTAPSGRLAAAQAPPAASARAITAPPCSAPAVVVSDADQSSSISVSSGVQVMPRMPSAAHSGIARCRFSVMSIPEPYRAWRATTEARSGQGPHRSGHRRRG